MVMYTTILGNKIDILSISGVLLLMETGYFVYALSKTG